MPDIRGFEWQVVTSGSTVAVKRFRIGADQGMTQVACSGYEIPFIVNALQKHLIEQHVANMQDARQNDLP